MTDNNRLTPEADDLAQALDIPRGEIYQTKAAGTFTTQDVLAANQRRLDRIAAAHRMDLGPVEGTGPNGVVTPYDVDLYIAAHAMLGTDLPGARR